VDPESGSIQEAFLDALIAIRRRTSCSFELAGVVEGVPVDFSRANVIYENGGATWLFPDVGSAAGCGDGGWYYDNPDEPGWIILCEETCELVTAEGSGGLEIRLACVIG
jgi:hypothetical protein